MNNHRQLKRHLLYRSPKMFVHDLISGSLALGEVNKIKE